MSNRVLERSTKELSGLRSSRNLRVRTMASENKEQREG